MKKNYILKPIRISGEIDLLLNQVSNKTGFPKNKIVRWLLNRGIMQLQTDILSAGGLEKLQFNLKEISKINYWKEKIFYNFRYNQTGGYEKIIR